MAGSTSSASPTSPSTYSFGQSAASSSLYTSEEQPDLGAGFRTVLREWTYLQPPPRIPTYIRHHSSSQNESLESQTEDGRRSTVWAYEPIAQYLDDRETETDTDTTRSVHIETETETETETEPSASSTASLTPTVSLVDDYTLTLRTQPSPPASGSLEFEFDLESIHTNLGFQHERESGPSLGYLDQALSFIAAERAQLVARTSLSQPDAWRHVVDRPSTATRRKRRRRKSKQPSQVYLDDDDGAGESYRDPAGPEDSNDDAEGDDEQSPCYHSILKYQSKSTPLTPRPRSPASPSSPSLTPKPSFSLLLPIKVEPCNGLSSSDSPFASHTSGEPKRAARKRTRAKPRKPPVTSSASLVFPPPSFHTHMLTHARSVPSLRILAGHQGVGDTCVGLGDSTVGVPDLEGIDGPTKKLIALARYLVKISPAQRQVLDGVERKMVVQTLRRLRAGTGLDTSRNSGGVREEKEKNGDVEGSEDEGEEDGDEEDVLDPRGRIPKEGDPPVHVFVDHSNILFGLLNYLKRHPHLTTSANCNQMLKNRSTGVNNGQGSTNDNAKSRSRINLNTSDTTETGKTVIVMKEKKIIVPRILTRPHATTSRTTTTNTNTTATIKTAIPISSNLTNLTSTPKAADVSVPTNLIQTQAQAYMHTTPIPLPSFATALTRNTILNPSISAAIMDVPYVKQSTGAGTDTTGTDTTPASAGTTSPMKTRARSRSRKVRKAAQAQAQHAMFRTSVTADDSEHDVVLFSGRRSLRQVGEGVGSKYEYESRVVVADGYGEKDEEADAQSDVEWEEERGELEVEVEDKCKPSGRGAGRSHNHDQGQGEGESDGEDGDEGPDVKAHAQIQMKNEMGTRTNKSAQRQRHLSHTALALILERGRPVSRRVAVTSSPLYQPMDTLERLGYEVRVYIRVPDLGDGMDRTAKKKSHSHKRLLSGGTTSGGDGSGAGSGSPETPPLKSALSPFTQQQISFPASTSDAPTTPATPVTPTRVRYREQGVDELLQLKLHQVLAATDDVPPGATIVLATGDGNVGQFSEDGFLGPVRTALKRGWRVELYAWEEGLSRAWRREFGLESEWARNGMFQIIGLEQFAASLIKGEL